VPKSWLKGLVGCNAVDETLEKIYLTDGAPFDAEQRSTKMIALQRLASLFAVSAPNWLRLLTLQPCTAAGTAGHPASEHHTFHRTATAAGTACMTARLLSY